MTSVKFTREDPKGDFALALELEKGLELPAKVVDAVKRRPYDPVVEIFWEAPWGCRRTLFIQLEGALSRKKYEEAGSALYNKFKEAGGGQLVIDIRNRGEEGLHLLTGFLLASWCFDKYQTLSQGGNRVDLLTFVCQDPKEMERKFARFQAVIEGVFYARSLTSEPPNKMPPMAYTERLKDLEEFGVEVTVLDERVLVEERMEALLAVGRGSKNKPAVAVMKWKGADQKVKPVVLVGKGICFDSGGLCLKPPKQQVDMKWDKAGAGVVAGVIKALALQKAPVNLIGVVGLAENMPDGNAVRPGDVVTTRSGQTVEIVDTDAEGRLVLADCLWYAKENFAPSQMVDLGTLCLETVACLGHQYGGLYSNSENLISELKLSGEISGEELWQLPMGPFFAKQINSSVADMKNVGLESCGENGASAEFLKRFVGDTPWAHIDMAGVAWTQEDLPLARKGVTGFGVRLLEEWIMSKI